MAKGTLNKVQLIGRMGADPEIRYMPSGGAVANMRLATNESYKDRQTGQNVDQTEWHRVVCFGKLAEIVGEYVRKGSLIYIDGRIRTNKWQDQSGQDRYTTEIIANEMQLLGGRGDGGGSSATSNNFDQTRQTSAPAAAAPQTAPTAPAPDLEDFDDEVPF